MLEKLPAIVGRSLRRVRPGLERIVAENRGISAAPSVLKLESDVFEHGRELPARYTSDGEGISPPLRWWGTPEGTRSLVLIVEDADSPTLNPLVHAIVFGLPPVLDGLVEGEMGPHGDQRILGMNSYFQTRWLPPDPPPGHGPHRYAFQLFALDAEHEFEGHPGRMGLINAIRGHVIGRGVLIGTYQRR
ncbi:YbhB/YbcL family Raf kinase inhibitor-like protein [soil metagenome]